MGANFQRSNIKKVAFYIMISKGYFVLRNFVDKFGSECIEYVVSSEDKSLQKDFYIEIKQLCQREKIRFYNRSEDISNLEREFSGYKFAIAWRWLIKNEKNLIILHDSLLPKYRGFAPLINSLINNEKEFGVTAFFATGEYDKGDIIAQKKIEIDYPIKINELIQKIEPLYFECVSEIYTKIKKGKKLNVITQDESKATYSVWLDDEDYFVDWSWSAEKIKRFIDAVGFPYDNAKAYVNNELVKIIDAEIVDDVVIENRERHIGKVIFFKEGSPIVICGSGLLKLKDIRDKDGNKVNIKFRSRFKSFK